MKLKSDEEILEGIQQNCSTLLQIIFDKMNEPPAKPLRTLRDIYLDQFVNINEQQLKGIYNDRQRNLRKISK